MKVPELLANIFSILNILILIIKITNEIVKNFNFNVRLINTIYEYEDKESQPKKIRLNIKDNNNINEIYKDGDLHCLGNNSNSRTFKSKIKNCNSNIANNIPLFEQSLSPGRGSNVVNLKFNYNKNIKHKKFFYTISETVNFLCCPCSRDKKLMTMKKQYEIGKDVIGKFLNIENFIRKMIEIDFLKYLFLNENQLNLINLINLPTIDDAGKKKNFKTEGSFSSQFTKVIGSCLHSKDEIISLGSDEIFEIYNSYNKIKQLPINEHDINYKLLDSVKGNFEQLFLIK